MSTLQKIFAITGTINYLLVIFLNAFTDLGHKIIIQNTIFKIYDGDTQIVLTAIVNALIILPFILVFSPTGFLADRFPKNEIMKYGALFAIFITLGITYAYYNSNFFLAFTLTFLLAFQSAIYGPAKYGYIKELVGEKFISSGNGAVQAVTTIAILGGMLFYTVLFEMMLNSEFTTKEDILALIAPLGWLLVIGSVIQFLLATKLPNKMPKESQKKFHLNRYIKGEYLRKNMKIVTRKREIFEAIIALSLFWSISQVVLAVFGEYAKSELDVTNTIYIQGVMMLAGIGMVIGSILSANFSKYFINIGLVAIGAGGITVLVFMIPFASSMVTMALIFFIFGLFSGFLMVPLNAKIQLLSPRVHLGTILAGNNFIQYIFMFISLVLTTLFAFYGVEAEYLIDAMVLVGVVLTTMLIKRYFLMSIWATMEILLSFRYKFIYIGLENIPNSKGVLLLGNHISWLDWLIVQLPIQRRINFMMDKEIYNWKGFHYFFKLGETIPVSKKASKDAFKEASSRLKNEKIVGIFPEGGITKDGKLGKFHRGYELISKEYDGVVVPFFIEGMFGSRWARYDGDEKSSIFKYFRRREVRVYFGKSLAKDVEVSELKMVVEGLNSLGSIK